MVISTAGTILDGEAPVGIGVAMPDGTDLAGAAAMAGMAVEGAIMALATTLAIVAVMASMVAGPTVVVTSMTAATTATRRRPYRRADEMVPASHQRGMRR